MIKLFHKNTQQNGNNQTSNLAPIKVAPVIQKISLKGKIISKHLLNIIPAAIAQKYSAVFFDESETTLKLAVGHPDKLKTNFSQALDGIEKKLNKTIELYQVNSDEIIEVFHPQITVPVSEDGPLIPPPSDTLKTAGATHHVPPVSQMPTKPIPSTTSVPPSAPPAHTPIPTANFGQSFSSSAPIFSQLPKLYMQGEIPYEVFAHIPYFFAQNHQFICIDFVPPNKYTVATQRPDSPETRVIINYLKKNNNLDFTLYQASPRQFEFLLREYKEQETKTASLFQKQKSEANKQIVKQTKELANINKITKKFQKQPLIIRPQPKVNETINVSQPKLAEGVISPDLKGKIVSGEKEKLGFSGALEKIGSLFGTPKVGAPENIEPLELKPESPTLVPTKQTQKPTEPVETPKIVNVQEVPAVEAHSNVVDDQVKETKKDQEVKDDENLGSLLKDDVKTVDELKAIVKENNIPKTVAAIVSYAISQNASDVHAEPFEDELLIRYRIDGQLRNIIKLPPDMHAPLISRIKILSKLKLDETRIPQDGRFNVVFSTREVDLRVSTMPAVHGEKGVLRILDKTKGVISLENLGFLGMGFDILIDSINRPYGIIIATGPTGSGKSTTLYAILARVATSTVNVITLEDPVEYEMKGINQSQINPKIGYTFADGLRSILRQDPNIIMVGEVRDGETANMATQAALTGHLVLTTLHTNNASGALPRLINMGIEPFLITSSINAIIGQRLVRKICDDCKAEITLPEGVIKEVEDELANIPAINTKDQARIKRPFKFYQGKGCDKCHNTGYKGRIGLYEILPMSERIEELTISRATANQMLDQAVKEGMITMKQDGILKVLSGITTLDEILKETSEK